MIKYYHLSDYVGNPVKELCEKFNIEQLKLDINMIDIERAIGKRCGIIGITNSEMAKRINEIIVASNEEECIL